MFRFFSAVLDRCVLKSCIQHRDTVSFVLATTTCACIRLGDSGGLHVVLHSLLLLFRFDRGTWLANECLLRLHWLDPLKHADSWQVLLQSSFVSCDRWLVLCSLEIILFVLCNHNMGIIFEFFKVPGLFNNDILGDLVGFSRDFLLSNVEMNFLLCACTLIQVASANLLVLALTRGIIATATFSITRRLQLQRVLGRSLLQLCWGEHRFLRWLIYFILQLNHEWRRLRRLNTLKNKRAIYGLLNCTLFIAWSLCWGRWHERVRTCNHNRLLNSLLFRILAEQIRMDDWLLSNIDLFR